MPRPRKLLTIAHSYVVGLNRRLAHEIARAGADRWEVTAVAPRFVHGDLRPIALEGHRDDELLRLETVPLYFSRRIHIALYGLRLRQLLAQNWDLVHCWEEPYVLAGAQVAALTRRTNPLVFWTAQNISKTYPPPFSWLEHYCLRRCAAWLACGQSVVDALLPRGYAARPYRIIPLGVDLEHFRPDPVAGSAVRAGLGWSPDGPPVIGYLGRFVPEKGVRLLVEALDGVTTSWRALFVGGGPLEGELRGWAARRPEQVRIVTDVPHNLVPGHLCAMDVLCAPSQTTPRWREQLGRMLIEAFACGVPVVGSDSGEIPHVVGDFGLVVPESDVAGWSNTLAALLESPSRRRELAERGHSRAQDFSWARIARQHLDLFEMIQGGQNTGDERTG
jgi:glycosyltransferase involved in cell wall biosynthesis